MANDGLVGAWRGTCCRREDGGEEGRMGVEKEEGRMGENGEWGRVKNGVVFTEDWAGQTCSACACALGRRPRAEIRINLPIIISERS